MYQITEEPLDPKPLVEAVRRDESGAVARTRRAAEWSAGTPMIAAMCFASSSAWL